MEPWGVSVVIPNYNGAEYLTRCVQSLLDALASYPANHEIIVVDDGSADHSVALLKNEFSSVHILRHHANMGFGVSCNDGVRQAQNEIVLLLNTDTYVDKSFLYPLLSHFGDDDSLFGVGCKMIDWATGAQQIGRIYGTIEHGIVDGMHVKDKGLTSVSETCFICAGACAIDKDKYVALGGIAELHRRSDIELSYRARKRGWRMLYEPRSIVYHKGMGTDRKIWNDPQIHTMKCREKLLLNWRNVTDRDLLIKHVLTLPLLPFHWGFRSTAVAFWGAMQRLPEVIRFRRSERPNIKRSDRDVLTIGQDARVS